MDVNREVLEPMQAQSSRLRERYGPETRTISSANAGLVSNWEEVNTIEVVNKYLQEKSPRISGDGAVGPSNVKHARLNTQQATRLWGREAAQ